VQWEWQGWRELARPEQTSKMWQHRPVTPATQEVEIGG
jgi:hypothetical protein